jgi:raffinose/stachyose/melibiose transport system substrate-binding protein
VTPKWKDASVTKANQNLQDLAKAGAFGDNASSVSYDQGASTALLYTGKAAMEVMGTWEYANIAKAAPDFLKKGDLGYTAFPSLTGGAGDPDSIVGNPSNFLSLNSSTKHKSAALTYLKDYVLNGSQVDAYLAAGSVPPVKGLDSKLAAVKSSSDKAWLTFVYDLVEKAPELPALLGPGTAVRPGRPAADQHRQVVPAADLARGVRVNMSKAGS